MILISMRDKSFTINLRSVLPYFMMGGMLLFFGKIQAQVFFNSTHIPVFHPQFEQPALMGSHQEVRLMGAYRYQWAGIEGAPMTMYLGGDMPLPVKNLSGGVFVSHDRAGATYYTQANMALSYAIPFKVGKLNVGAKLGLVNTALDGSKLITPNPNDEDPTLYAEKESGIRPDVSLGFAYIHKFFQFGAYMSNVADFQTSIKGLDADANYSFGRYVGIGGNADIPVGKDFSLKPSLLMRTDLINFQMDVSLSASYQNKYSLGLGYRGYNKLSNESLSVISKIHIVKDLAFMYSYDVTLNELNKVGNGSHEISLEYVFPKKFISNRTKIVNNPRYL